MHNEQERHTEFDDIVQELKSFKDKLELFWLIARESDHPRAKVLRKEFVNLESEVGAVFNNVEVMSRHKKTK